MRGIVTYPVGPLDEQLAPCILFPSVGRDFVDGASLFRGAWAHGAFGSLDRYFTRNPSARFAQRLAGDLTSGHIARAKWVSGSPGLAAGASIAVE